MYATRNVLRLYFNDIRIILKHNHSMRNQSINVKKIEKKDKSQLEIYETYKDKIIFNSHLKSERLKMGYYRYYLQAKIKAERSQAQEYANKCIQPLPLALQYVVEKNRLLDKDNEHIPQEPEKIFQLPLANTTKLTVEDNNNATAQTGESKHSIDQWMTAYESFDDTTLNANQDEDDVDHEWRKQYGTPDIHVQVSHVPCGGCGALLHCNDPSIPGYLPSEIFKGASDDDLRTTECQRCHFLKEYNIALDVSVQPEEYERLLQSIRHVKSLVVLMVDLLDFPCSIWPDIVDIIGTNRPLFIVGNKVDLLPGDSVGYLKRVEDALRSEINKTKLRDANIKYMGLISAQTGYGVEDLISNMFKIWLAKGDVFLIGCTNVGKSSLFNALLQSDYCKVHAVDIVKRATVSQWPGTTLNLLKFPINRPSGWKIYTRSQRLKTDKKLLKYENEIRKNQVEGKAASALPTLIGHIGRSFSDPKEYSDYFSSESSGLRLFDDKVFAQSKWFFDTPGVIHPDQVLPLLTTEELLITIPKQLIRPQTYYLREGTTIFIGGLARIDFIECKEACRFTVFCAHGLPITITKTEDADDVYNKFLGTDLFVVPSGGQERLKNWPGLQKMSHSLNFVGEGPKICCGDVVLSSVAWVSVTAKRDTVCKLNAWTPEARGIHLRNPSMLPYAINLKGKRVEHSPAYMVGNVFVENKK